MIKQGLVIISPAVSTQQESTQPASCERHRLVWAGGTPGAKTSSAAAAAGIFSVTSGDWL